MELVVDRQTKEPVGAADMGAIANEALRRGVVVIGAGTYGNVIRLLPPITIDEALLDNGLDQVHDALTAVLA